MDTQTKELTKIVDIALLEQVKAGRKSGARVLNRASWFVSEDNPPPYSELTDSNLLGMYRYNIVHLNDPGRSPPSGGDQRGVGKLTLLTLEKYLFARGLIKEVNYARRFRTT